MNYKVPSGLPQYPSECNGGQQLHLLIFKKGLADGLSTWHPAPMVSFLTAVMPFVSQCIAANSGCFFFG
jgi:hypothetical protein